jgi:hypothetical protein
MAIMGHPDAHLALRHWVKYVHAMLGIDIKISQNTEMRKLCKGAAQNEIIDC